MMGRDGTHLTYHDIMQFGFDIGIANAGFCLTLLDSFKY